jgi:hypothetical protein
VGTVRPTTGYRPGIATLRAAAARVVVAAATAARGQVGNGAAVASAAQLGMLVVEFPMLAADARLCLRGSAG